MCEPCQEALTDEMTNCVFLRVAFEFHEREEARAPRLATPAECQLVLAHMRERKTRVKCEHGAIGMLFDALIEAYLEKKATSLNYQYEGGASNLAIDRSNVSSNFVCSDEGVIIGWCIAQFLCERH